jgi:putative endonuclease
MEWDVYVLHNKIANKIYIGQTNDLERRLLEHNEKRGNHFTAKYKGKWELIYKEEFKTRKEAIKREKQLKSYRGREFVRQYISL